MLLALRNGGRGGGGGVLSPAVICCTGLDRETHKTAAVKYENTKQYERGKQERIIVISDCFLVLLSINFLFQHISRRQFE